MAESKWKGRVRKTQQDRNPNAGSRPRTQEWDRRRQWAIDHKPARSADWLAYRKVKAG